MSRIGYAPGAFDLFHIGHLNLLRTAKTHCDFLIAGVASDAVLLSQKGRLPVVPFEERLEIARSCRYVDQTFSALTANKMEIWQELHFDVLFKGDDWRGTVEGQNLEREFAAVGVEVVYFPYCKATSSSRLRQTLDNIDELAAEIRNANGRDRSFSPSTMTTRRISNLCSPSV